MTPSPQATKTAMNPINTRVHRVKRSETILDVLVDEFTLVLQTENLPDTIDGWGKKAKAIAQKFIELSLVEVLLGELSDDFTMKSLPAGYTSGYVTMSDLFYFAIAWHEDFLDMGVCIRMSAKAWSYYQEAYFKSFDTSINIHEFLQNIKSNMYRSRLSRIDIAIDFIDENVNVNTIYNQLSRGNQHIRNSNGRRNHSSYSGLTKNNYTSTFYVGTRGRNTKALLRVYDKKLEQLETFGVHYQEALSYTSWVRFEASYRGSYAHELTRQLSMITNDTELKDLLVSAIIDRYQFYYTKSERLTIFTRQKIDLLNSQNFVFSSPSPRNNSLEQSQRHILKGSGLFAYLYKIYSIWGDKGLIDCLIFLQDEFGKYEPNDDVILWLKKYEEIYRIQGYPFK